MLPRFANPHTISQDVSTISREEIYGDPEEDDILENTEDHNSTLTTLERLVKQSLGEYNLGVIADSGDSPKRKKKRRRIDLGRESELPIQLHNNDGG